MIDNKDLNPRWVNYFRVQGRTHEEQLEYDRKRWPGGCMCGFILWNGARLKEFSVSHPEAFTASGLVDHASYDLWLDALPIGHGVDELQK